MESDFRICFEPLIALGLDVFRTDNGATNAEILHDRQTKKHDNDQVIGFGKHGLVSTVAGNVLLVVQASRHVLENAVPPTKDVHGFGGLGGVGGWGWGWGSGARKQGVWGRGG